MAALLPLLAREVVDPRPGGEAVATLLADVLVIETVRVWLADDPAGAAGWLAALRDPCWARCWPRVHREPGLEWTLPELPAARRCPGPRSPRSSPPSSAFRRCATSRSGACAPPANA